MFLFPQSKAEVAVILELSGIQELDFAFHDFLLHFLKKEFWQDYAL